MGNKIFSTVPPANVPQSAFDLSYDKKLTMDMGQLIPILCDMVLPGDVWSISNRCVIRAQPMQAPVLHEINVYVHYFYVPLRLLWPNTEVEGVLTDGFEPFITGGREGDLTPAIPTWSPTNNAIGSLWDYLGFPTGIVPTGRLPMDFPRRAYNMVYNEYYRDANLTDKIALTNENILNRCWEKDRFTSALLEQQRGTAPSFPVTGLLPVDYPAVAATDQFTMLGSSTLTGAPYNTYTKMVLETGRVDLSNAVTFDVSDVRLAFQIQKMLERSARAGSRYTEHLKAFFNVYPRDERMQRPEYIGGSKAPLIVSEVLQTSSTDAITPQGNLAGHGMSVNNQYCGTYRAVEYGIIIGLLSIMPRTAYQQGVDRQWLATTRYDFYNPLFANLSEQAIERVELYATADANDNATVFGYTGRWNEHRSKLSQVCGDMRDTFDYWHFGRKFSPTPELNETFVKCVPTKTPFAVEEEPGFVVNFGNIIKARRSLPYQATPGMVDH